METIDKEIQQKEEPQTACPIILQAKTMFPVPTSVLPPMWLSVPLPPVPPPAFVLPPSTLPPIPEVEEKLSAEEEVLEELDEKENENADEEVDEKVPEEEEKEKEVDDTGSSNANIDQSDSSEIYFNNLFKNLFDARIELTFFCNTPGFYRNGCWYNWKYNFIPGVFTPSTDLPAEAVVPPFTTVVVTLPPPPQIPTVLMDLVGNQLPAHSSVGAVPVARSQDESNTIVEVKIIGTQFAQVTRPSIDEVIIETGPNQKNSMILKIASRSPAKTLDEDLSSLGSFVIQTTMSNPTDTSKLSNEMSIQVPFKAQTSTRTTGTTTTTMANTTPISCKHGKVETCDRQIQVFPSPRVAMTSELLKNDTKKEQLAPLLPTPIEFPKSSDIKDFVSTTNTESESPMGVEWKPSGEDSLMPQAPLRSIATENEAFVANIAYWPPLGTRSANKCRSWRRLPPTNESAVQTVAASSKQRSIGSQRSQHKGESSNPGEKPQTKRIGKQDANQEMEDKENKSNALNTQSTKASPTKKTLVTPAKQIKLKCKKEDISKNQNARLEAYTSNMFDILGTIDTTSGTDETDDNDGGPSVDTETVGPQLTCPARRKNLKKKKPKPNQSTVKLDENKDRNNTKKRRKPAPKTKSVANTQSESCQWRDLTCVNSLAICRATGGRPTRSPSSHSMASSSSSEGPLSLTCSESSDC